MKLGRSLAALFALGAVSPGTQSARADVVLCSGVHGAHHEDPYGQFNRHGWFAANCRPTPGGVIPMGTIIGAATFCRVNTEYAAQQCNVPYDPSSNALYGNVTILPRDHESHSCEKISCTGSFVPVPDGQAKRITAVRDIPVTERVDFMVSEIHVTCTCSD